MADRLLDQLTRPRLGLTFKRHVEHQLANLMVQAVCGRILDHAHGMHAVMKDREAGEHVSGMWSVLGDPVSAGIGCQCPDQG
jgi:hypothetical protein